MNFLLTGGVQEMMPEQAQAMVPPAVQPDLINTIGIGWTVGILLAPWLLSLLATIVEVRSKRYRARKQKVELSEDYLYYYAKVSGFLMGAFFQWGTQELVALLLAAQVFGWKAAIVSGVATALFAGGAYDFLRGWSSTRPRWQWLTVWLTVERRKDRREAKGSGNGNGQDDFTKFIDPEDKTLPQPSDEE